MRKLLISLGLVTVGVVVMYLMDPERGRSRRARLADQAKARSKDVADAVSAKAKYQAGVVKGAAHEVAEVFTSHDDGYDDETLLQKVRSEAIGPAGLPDIQVDVTDGEVTISGSLDDEKAKRRLIKSIQKVDGVRAIDDFIEVGAPA